MRDKMQAQVKANFSILFHLIVITVNVVCPQTHTPDRCDTSYISWYIPHGCAALFGWQMWSALSYLCYYSSVQNGTDVHVWFIPGMCFIRRKVIQVIISQFYLYQFLVHFLSHKCKWKDVLCISVSSKLWRLWSFQSGWCWCCFW